MSWFSRLTLQANNREELKQLNSLRESPYAQHQALWRLFDATPGSRQPFVFRKMDSEIVSVLRLLVVSKEAPNNQNGWQVESKPYHPQMQVGDRFNFSVRLNPTRSEPSKDTMPNGRRTRGKRQDFVISRLHQLQPPKEQRAAERQRIVHEELPQWLAKKAEKNGFFIEDCAVERYAVQRTRKNEHEVTLGMADFSGILRVTDKNLLRHALLNGLGHGRSFGMGLLLLKPR